MSNVVPASLSWDHLFGWQQAITSTLKQFAQSPDFQSQIQFIFGDNFNSGKLNTITSGWLVGDFNLLPQIEVLDSPVFPTGTLGAFAGVTNKIYINEQLLSSENTELIQETVIEEVGHWVDKEINRVDAFGDEGQLFAAVVTGKHLNADQIAEIKTEDDTTEIFANGQFLTVEQSTLPTINISATDASAAETLTGQTVNPGRFTLTRTGDTASALTVNYTIAGTATNGTDYTSLPGTVSFAAGASTALINVTPINDTISEATETVTLNLATGTGYNLGTTKTAIVSLADNDIPVITIVASDGSEIWTLSSNLTPGSDYQIKITSVNNGSVSDQSNSNYSIIPNHTGLINDINKDGKTDILWRSYSDGGTTHFWAMNYWGTGSPNGDSRLPSDNFIVRAYTFSYFDGGEYKFRFKSDDYIQLFAYGAWGQGGQHYITPQNQWVEAYGYKEVTYTLPAGWYDLHFQMWEGGIDAHVDLSWEKITSTNPNYIYNDADYLNALYQDNVANAFSRKDHNGTSAFDSDDSAPNGADGDNRVYALVGGEVIEAKNGKEVSSKYWGYNGTVAIYNKDLNKTFIYWHFAEGSINENLKGTTIAAGSLIGIEGNTGASYGSHTHVEVHEGRAYVNMSDPNNPKSPANSSRLNVASIFQEAVRKGLVKLYI